MKSVLNSSALSFCVVAITTPLLLTSCSGESEHTDISISPDSMKVSVPGFIRTVRELTGTELELRVSLGDEVIRRIRATNEDSVTVSVQIPQNDTQVTLAWYALIDDSQWLLLADRQETIVAGETQVSINSYISSDDNSADQRFDYDNDGRTNISEVRENRNPLSAIDYQVPFSNANFRQPNLTITANGTDDGASGNVAEADKESTFTVWHNGVDLILYVCGQDQTLSESSDQYWHDDTIFVFFDGRNDDDSEYDDVDDYQIAFVRSTGERIASQGGSNPGCPNGSCITSYSFYSNSSSCEYEFSARFPLASMNISTEPGATFGFDIELTDDDNGGDRDDSAGWIGFEDQSHIDPSTFGTLQLESP